MQLSLSLINSMKKSILIFVNSFKLERLLSLKSIYLPEIGIINLFVWIDIINKICSNILIERAIKSKLFELSVRRRRLSIYSRILFIIISNARQFQFQTINVQKKYKTQLPEESDNKILRIPFQQNHSFYAYEQKRSPEKIELLKE